MSARDQIIELVERIINMDELPNPESYIYIIKSYLKNEKYPDEVVLDVIYYLREVLIDLSQSAAEEFYLEDSEDLKDDDTLLKIWKISEVIKVLSNKSDDNKINENREVMSPKMAIFLPSAINELKSIPIEEKTSFLVPIGYIKDGGAKLNVGVKIITTIGSDKKVLEYRNPTSTARVFAYKITKDLIYVVKIVLKKGGWPKALKKSILEKKPTTQYTLKLKEELESIKGYERLKEKSERQLEEVLSIIAEGKEEREDNYSKGLCIVNELLSTHLNFEDNSIDEILISERIYYLLTKINEIEDSKLKYEKIGQMEKIMFEVLKEYITSKSEDELLKVRKMMEVNDISQMNKASLILERRILYILNYFKDEEEELKKIEKRIILNR